MSDVSDKVDALFQLKADFFPITVVKLPEADLSRVAVELDNTIDKAPKYLYQAPIVIDVRDMLKEEQAALDIAKLCTLFKSKQVIPVGIRGLRPHHHAKAIQAGLAVMKSRDISLAEGHRTSPAVKPKSEPVSTMAKVITKPVRSGTQVYAKGTDLVILAAVNAGAECIADGNIHIYGPLRGRALAGANGNKQAHIFCESLEAELIAVAGHYLTKDQIKPPKTNKPLIDICLNGDKLKIDGI